MLTRAVFPIVIVFALILTLAQSGCATTSRRQTKPPTGVFVHIKSGPQEAHSFLMGLRMAQMMSEDRDVLVYIDVHGLEVILKNAPGLDMKPFGSSQAMIRDLVSRGVPVYACPGCLKALGKKPEDLMPGIQIAQKPAFFKFTDGRILTFDY